MLKINFLDLDSSGKDILSTNRIPNSQYFTFWGVGRVYPNDKFRYHLGQLYVIEILKELSLEGLKTFAVICDTEPLVFSKDQQDGMRRDIETIRRFLHENLRGCSDIRFLSEMIKNEKNYYKDDFNYYHNGILHSLNYFRNTIDSGQLPDPINEEINKFRDPLSNIKKINKNVLPMIRAANSNFRLPLINLLPIIYIYRNRPAWFEISSLADVSSFFTCYNKRHENKPMVLIEAKRNSYSWMFLQGAFRYGFKNYKKENYWPRMGFIDNVPGLNGNEAMQLNNPENCIFMDSSSQEIQRQLKSANSEVISKIHYMITGINKNISTQEKSNDILGFIKNKQEINKPFLTINNLLEASGTSNLHSTGEIAVYSSNSNPENKQIILYCTLFVLVFFGLITGTSFLMEKYGFFNLANSFFISFATFSFIVVTILLLFKRITPKLWKDIFDKILKSIDLKRLWKNIKAQ